MAGRARNAAGSKAEEGEGTKGAAAEAPLRPSQCRAYMRRTLAREFRGIVDGFVKSAKRGSCQHVKLATELMDAPPRRPVRRKGAVQQLLEKMERGEV